MKILFENRKYNFGKGKQDEIVLTSIIQPYMFFLIFFLN